MASYADILFGRIVLKNRLASLPQVNDCLKRAHAGQSLGEAMVETGLLRADQAGKVKRAQALMQFMRAERTFARILVDQRLVDLDTLRKCFDLQEQRRHKVRIAQILMERGLLTAEQNEAIVDRQLVLLADETARYEELGLSGVLAESSQSRTVDKLSNLQKVEDLDNSTMKKAVGPKGLFDAPSAELVRRTLPMMKAVQLDEAPRRTLLMGGDPEDSRAETMCDEDGLVGRTIASRYRILSKVGEGGMGTVYKAEHCLMEKIVALKVLHPTLLSSKASLDRFRLEIRAASRFQHKNVIQIYDAGEGEGGIFYMAMEFAQGVTLEEMIQDSGAQDVDTTVRFLRQALTAVGEAHKKKIIHRDLKSGNLMVVQGKDGEQLVKVMDFGIAKFAFDEESGIGEVAPGSGLYRTQEGIVTGTPQYMSPEQASGEKVDHRSDLYSIGVILFEMLTGELPFKSNTPMGFLGKHIVEPAPRPSSVNPGLPVVLEEVTLRLLEKRPSDRYQSAEDVLKDLDMRCSGEQLKVISGSELSGYSGGSSSARSPAMTIAVAAPQAPLRSPPPYVEPPAALGQTIITPPPVPPESKKTWAIAFGLVLLLVTVVILSTVLAMSLADGPPANDGVDPQKAMANAQVLLKSGDIDEAVALLELVKDPAPPLLQLLERARALKKNKDEAASLAERAIQLDESFRSGNAGQEAAKEAIRHYRLSLDLLDDAAVRSRLTALEGRLEEIRRPTTPDASQGLALLIEGTEALQGGDMATAAEKLRQASDLLPAGHKALKGLKRHLEAEQLMRSAARAREAGKLADAKRQLEKALPLHPDAQTQSRLKSEIAELGRSVALAERRGTIDVDLKSSLESALNLELERAEEFLAKAILTAKSVNLDDPRITERKNGLAQLARFADRLASAEDKLAAQTQTPRGVTSDDVQAVLTALRGFEERLTALASVDPDLGKGLALRLKSTLAKGAKLAETIDAMQEQFKSDRLKRFERRLNALREDPSGRETPTLVDRRLNDFLDLQDRSAYVKREASKQDRDFIDKTVKRYQMRRAVWLDLNAKEVESAEMVQIPGGSWKAPGGKTYDLPKVYYMSVNEITCAEWYRFMRATRTKKPASFPGPTDEPVRFVSLRDVNNYCRWRSRLPNGKNRTVRYRLPTEPEWERAVRGPKGTTFPWGEAFENWRAGYAAVDGKLNKVQRYTRDKNAWGLWDVVGNVSEMTTLFGNKNKVVIRGGSAASKRSDTGADFRKPVRSGDEVSGYTGFRLLAVER